MSIKSWLDKLKKSDSSVSEDYQTTLSPLLITEDKPQYKTVRNIAHRLKMGDALNIALTGPYGSGKSSILRTLEKDFPNYHYLSISLATLKSSIDKKNEDPTVSKEVDTAALNSRIDKDDKKNEDPTVFKEVDTAALNSRIEYSILQQLEYKEKQDTLYYSRFKRIYYKPWWNHLLKAIGVVLYFICLIVFFKPSLLRVDWIIQLLNNKWIDVFSLLYLFISTIVYVYKIIKSLCNSKLNRLSLMNGEIELQEETSVLNNHLDEIVYFFQATEYNVVIIEDLDRFNNTDIFLKLREINYLLNQSKAIGRKIFFIYAVRDDLFVNEDRAKFFDYITTVIPIINSSNSADKLIEELENKNICDCLSKEVIENIAFFIDDMRLLKNIVNEYAQYKEKLDKNLDQNKLLAMIVYKNYYPKDFADLHKGEGIIYKCLHMKEVLLNEHNIQLDKQIEEIKTKIEYCNRTNVLLERDLRLVYVEAYRHYIYNKGYQYIGLFQIGKSIYEDKIIAENEDLFNTFIQQPRIGFVYRPSNYLQNGEIEVPFRQIENIVNKEFTYKERLSFLRDGENKYKKQIKELESLRDNHYATPIKKLLEEINMQEHNCFKEINVPTMLESFLKDGLINEDYFDYISFYFGKSVDKKDHDFILELKLNHPYPYDYPINNVEMCIKNIPQNCYNNESVLNIQIVDYICQNLDKTGNKFRLCEISKIIVNKEKWDFMLEFYRKVENPKLLFQKVVDNQENDVDLWKIVEEQKEDDLFEAWIRFIELEHPSRKSKAWIENNYSFISRRVDKIGFDTIKEVINKNDIVFHSIDSASPELLDYLKTAKAYMLSHHNVSCLFAHVRNERINNFDNYPLSLTIIKNCKEAVDIYNYIYDNLESCLVDVFNTAEAKNECPEVIVELFESDKINDEIKRKYLKEQVNKISLKNIEDSDKWTLAVELDIVKPDWSNIFSFYEVQARVISDILHDFIENHIDELNKSDESDESGISQLSQENKTILAKSLLLKSQFDNKVFNKLMLIFEDVKFDFDEELKLLNQLDTNTKLNRVTDLIIKYKEDYSKIESLLNELGDEYKGLVNKQNIFLRDDERNRAMLMNLQNAGYISSFSKKDGKIRVYYKRK